jgi:Ni,Fe-hydrogenase III small subunit
VVTNGVAYAQAVEDVLGLQSNGDLARVRTILLELERVWSHLNDISAVCAGTGLAAGAQRFAGLTERARRLNAQLTGHRLLFGSIRVGGSDVTFDARAISFAQEELGRLRAEAASGWRELVFNRSFEDRLAEVGVVRAKDARRLGASGPAARAAGVAVDVRTASPRLAYEGFVPVVPSRAVGDVQSRLEQRHLELQQSLDLLETLLARPVQPCAAERGAPEQLIATSRGEPRGGTLCPERAAIGSAVHRTGRTKLAGCRLRGSQEHALTRSSRPSRMRAPTADAALLGTCAASAARSRCRGDAGAVALRHADCGSCNGCEHELILASSPYADLQRFGIGIVASPRHADVLLVTGPVTTRMREPLLAAWAAMPEPRRVVALGDCALGVDVLGMPEEIIGPVEAVLHVDLRIAGCPPTPDAIAAGLLELIDGKHVPLR